MGIRHLSTLAHRANNDQQRCYLAYSYWAIQIGYSASTRGLSRCLQECLSITPVTLTRFSVLLDLQPQI